MSCDDSQQERFFQIRPLQSNAEIPQKNDACSEMRWEVTEADAQSSFFQHPNISPLRSSSVRRQQPPNSFRHSQEAKVNLRKGKTLEKEVINHCDNNDDSSDSPEHQKEEQIVDFNSKREKRPSEQSTGENKKGNKQEAASGESDSSHPQNSPLNLDEVKKPVSNKEREELKNGPIKQPHKEKVKVFQFRPKLESVHEVENWKHYNREDFKIEPKKNSCVCVIF